MTEDVLQLMGSPVYDARHAEDIQTIYSIFMPESKKKSDRFLESQEQLAYYTTAETAFKIVHNRGIWLRSSLVMNDYSEIEYGQTMLAHAWASWAGIRLIKAMDAVHAGISDHLWHWHVQQILGMRKNTYILCVSEHLGEERENGRLSMWRAYGGRSGVALVVDKSVLSDDETGENGIFCMPVLYKDKSDSELLLDWIAMNIEQSADRLRQIDPEAIKAYVSRCLSFTVLSTKHPGFEEEREWRLIHSPFLTRSSMTQATEIINGVPQVIQKLAFKDMTRLKHIIIGPCDHPETVSNAFRQEINKMQLGERSPSLWQSNIPIRHQS